VEIFDRLSYPDVIWHPEYNTFFTDWKKWRLAYYGGRPFIEEYLRMLSSRETPADFAERKANTYVPAFAKRAINRVVNKISSQLGLVARYSTSKSYMDACDGLRGGVDHSGATMNYFISTEVLPELLIMGKVAVYIDMPKLEGNDLYSQQGARPYLYTYTREQLVNWTKDCHGSLNSIILRETTFDYDESLLVPKGYVSQYRHYRRLKENGKYIVFLSILDESFNEIENIRLNLEEIPVAIFELKNSLMQDIADYQIALLNMASSDISYAIKGNVGFYVEQYDMMAEATIDNIQRGYEDIDENGNSIAATEAVANRAANKEIVVGATKGRRIPKGLEMPQFINPSPDPLIVSMKKQEQMKKEIDELLDQAVEDLKGADKYGKPRAGLQTIGLELQSGENKIIRLWQSYENNKSLFHVNYPADFDFKPYSERVKESTDLTEVIPKLPSSTFRREVAKKAALALLGGIVDISVINTINDEIDAAPAVISDPRTISADMESGVCSAELGCELRGYPKGTHEVAQKEHADRLARIALTQGMASSPAMAARGVNDLSANAKEGKEEKKVSQSGLTDASGTKKVRGEGK